MTEEKKKPRQSILDLNPNAAMHRSAALLCLKDLELIFEFIEPCEANFNTYSHRNFELLLRLCTEFEAVCKMILLEVTGKAGENIKDYYAILDHCPVRGCWMAAMRFTPHPIEVLPFSDWTDREVGPGFYRAYNKVKHNRTDAFAKASLENVVDAMAGLVVLLSAAYGSTFLYPNRGFLHSISDGRGTTHMFDEIGIGYGASYELLEFFKKL